MNLRNIVDLTSVERSIRTIQEKINSLVACQKALYGVHNALVPISRLPHEVLSHIIFDFFVHESLDPGKCAKSCLIITRICRQWRRLAIDNPALWTKPPIYCTRLAQAMLERSGKMPLSISLEDKSELAPQVMSQFPRFKELRIHASADDLSNLLAAVTGPLPLLECLELNNSTWRTTGVLLRNESLEDVQNPRLKTLSLKNCTFLWTAACIVGLTSLSISMDYATQPEQRMTNADLLQILRQNPGLVKLVLSHKLLSEESIEGESTPMEAVLASQLKSITIDGQMNASFTIT